MTNANSSVLLVGAGNMCVEYAKVLASLGVRPVVFGRGEGSAARFTEKTGIAPSTGPLSAQIASWASVPDVAIVGVNAQYLASVTTALARAGVKRILVEKPAALDLAEMGALVAAVDAAGAKVWLGYNRRFMASVRRARSIVAADGGVLSVKFDFSEPARRIATLVKPQRELDTWFYGNSSHVVDLAFHFFGPPAEITGSVSGGVQWHPAAGVFTGHARNRAGALMSWHANWMAPGRWGLEVMTAEHRLILQPLEQLRVQSHDSFAEVAQELEDAEDHAFKPGLLRQVRAFLYGEDIDLLPTLHAHAQTMPYYEVVRTGDAAHIHSEPRT